MQGSKTVGVPHNAHQRNACAGRLSPTARGTYMRNSLDLHRFGGVLYYTTPARSREERDDRRRRPGRRSRRSRQREGASAWALPQPPARWPAQVPPEHRGVGQVSQRSRRLRPACLRAARLAEGGSEGGGEPPEQPGRMRHPAQGGRRPSAGAAGKARIGIEAGHCAQEFMKVQYKY